MITTTELSTSHFHDPFFSNFMDKDEPVNPFKNLTERNFINTKVEQQHFFVPRAQEVESLDEILLYIKESLMINKKSLFDILNVSRSTGNNLLDKEYLRKSSPIEETSSRIQALWEISQKIRYVTRKSSGTALFNHFVSGTSLFDLLCQKELNFASIYNTASRIYEKINKTSNSLDSDDYQYFKNTNKI